jgi:hypothetical protein
MTATPGIKKSKARPKNTAFQARGALLVCWRNSREQAPGQAIARVRVHPVDIACGTSPRQSPRNHKFLPALTLQVTRYKRYKLHLQCNLQLQVTT